MRSDLIALISYSFTNIATTLLIKLAGNVSVQQNGESRGFFHPFMQTEIMIIGEALCIVPYLLFQRGKKQPTQKLPSKVTLCLPPLILDLSSSILIFVAFNYLSASVFSVLTGEVVVFTAIFSKCFLNSSITRAQMVGSFLTIISAVLAGIGQSFADQTAEQFNLLLVGIVLVTIGMALQAGQAALYENIYTKYDISALEMVGYQGVSGFIIWTPLLILFKYTGCPFSDAQCVYGSDSETHLQDYSTFFDEMGRNGYLLALNLIFLIAVARYNYDLSTVIVKANAFTLCIIRISSNSFIWIIGIIVTVIGDDNPELNLQFLGLSVILVKLGAFILSAVGLLIYYQIILKGFFVGRHTAQNEELMESTASYITP